MDTNGNPTFSGRQALRMVDLHFEHTSARRTKALVQQLFSLTVKDRNLEEFIGKWESLEQKLTGSPDLPSALSLGSLLENKLSEVFKNDSIMEMLLMGWRQRTLEETDNARIRAAYNDLRERLITRCRIDRSNRFEQNDRRGNAAKKSADSKNKGNSNKSQSKAKGAAAKSADVGKGKKKGK